MANVDGADKVKRNKCRREVLIRYVCDSNGAGGCDYYHPVHEKGCYCSRRARCDWYVYRTGECINREAKTAMDAVAREKEGK